MKDKTIKLGEICKIVSGGTPSRSKPEYWQGGTLPWIKIGNINGKHVTEADEYITEEGLNGSSAKMLQKGTILYTIFATLGEVGILDIEACTNQAIAGLSIIDPNVVATDYLYYYLKSKKKEVNEIGRGVAQNNINMSILRGFEMPLPSIMEQDEIVGVLDKVANIIEARKNELVYLDELIKARFVEMFGDITKYPCEPLNDNVQEMFIGPFGSALKNECFVEPEKGYCIVYEQKHAIKKTMDVPTRYVDESKYNELRRFSVYSGDILVSCRGTIGEIFVVPDGAPLGIMHPSIMKIRLDTNKYDQKFFVLALGQYMEEHNNEAKGSGVKMAVTATALGKELFIVPPMHIQKRFVKFLEQVDKSKDEVQKSLGEAQLLFDSLMQEYFG